MKKVLIQLVREILKESFGKDISINLDDILHQYPQLKEDGATFITLTLNGDLRGCIGTLNAYQPLYQDIISNSLSAAFKDTRFEPLTYKEFKKIKIEISILSESKKVKYDNIKDLKSKIIPFVDGIILKDNQFSSTYLPSVWEQIPEFDDFFFSLAQKGGSEKLFLENNPKVYKYQVKKYEESFREAYNAGSFYPDKCKELKPFFNSLHLSDEKPRALIVPHAGYIYSGDIADAAYKYIDKSDFKRIVVIGPSHHYHFKGISGSFFEEYQTPCGNIDIDLKYLNKLKEKFNISFFKDAHRKEHSTETQMPFIKNYTNSKVIELLYSEQNNLSDIINYILMDKQTLLIISTDLSHFLPLQEANKIDMNCLKGIRNKDFDLLNKCDACGIIGVKSLMYNVRLLGLKTKVLKYKTSFETTGDESSVVGYMSAIIY